MMSVAGANDFPSSNDEIKHQTIDVSDVPLTKYSKEERVGYWGTVFGSIYCFSPISYKNVAKRVDSAVLQCLCIFIVSNLVKTLRAVFRAIDSYDKALEQTGLAQHKGILTCISYSIGFWNTLFNKNVRLFTECCIGLAITCFIVHRLLGIEILPGHLVLYFAPMSLNIVMHSLDFISEIISFFTTLLLPFAGIFYIFSSYSAPLERASMETKVAMCVVLYIFYFLQAFNTI